MCLVIDPLQVPANHFDRGSINNPFLTVQSILFQTIKSFSETVQQSSFPLTPSHPTSQLHRTKHLLPRRLHTWPPPAYCSNPDRSRSWRKYTPWKTYPDWWPARNPSSARARQSTEMRLPECPGSTWDSRSKLHRGNRWPRQWCRMLRMPFAGNLPSWLHFGTRCNLGHGLELFEYF